MSFSRWSPRSVTATSASSRGYAARAPPGRRGRTRLSEPPCARPVRRSLPSSAEARPCAAPSARGPARPRAPSGRLQLRRLRRRAGKGVEERVALSAHLHPASIGHRLTDDPAMTVQGRRILVAELVQQLGRALDVREEQRDRPCGQLPHRAPGLQRPARSRPALEPFEWSPVFRDTHREQPVHVREGFHQNPAILLLRLQDRSSSSGANDRSPYSACGTRRSARQERSIPQPGVLGVPASGSDRSAALSDDEREDPCPVQEGVPRVRVEEHRKVSVIRTCHPWDAVHDRECHDERDQNQPQLSAAAAAPRAAWRAKPEGLAKSSTSETCAARARAVRRAARTARSGPPVRHRSSAFTIGTFPSPVSRSASAGATSQASNAIGSAAAAQTASITCIPVLRNLYHRRRAVSRKPLVPLLGHFSGLIERG